MKKKRLRVSTHHLDPIYLHQALKLAQIRRGFCSPNPSVGAVIVKNEKVIAEGYHLGPGSAHAEVDALEKLQNKAQGTTVYVTLEPCCHTGRTPPCTEALIQAGVKHVVYGFCDPNPIVSGKGEAALRAAGIACEHVVLPEIDHFYESYHHWHITKKPFITAKIAMSLDGKIAGKSGEHIQITGAKLQEFTHAKRKTSDAILTTAKTIIQDDPQLNVRHQNEIIAKPLYILDSQLSLPATASIFKTAKSITVFHASGTGKLAGVRYVSVAKNQHGLNLTQIINHIGQDGIHDLWVEAGGQCFSAFMREQLLQRAFMYFAPCWLGEGLTAFTQDFSLNIDSCRLRWEQVGNDVLCDIRW